MLKIILLLLSAAWGSCIHADVLLDLRLGLAADSSLTVDRYEFSEPPTSVTYPLRGFFGLRVIESTPEISFQIELDFSEILDPRSLNPLPIIINSGDGPVLLWETGSEALSSGLINARRDLSGRFGNSTSPDNMRRYLSCIECVWELILNINATAEEPIFTLSDSFDSTFFRQEVVYEIYVATVPVPATLLMFGAGLVGLGAARITRQCNRAPTAPVA